MQGTTRTPNNGTTRTAMRERQRERGSENECGARRRNNIERKKGECGRASGGCSTVGFFGCGGFALQNLLMCYHGRGKFHTGRRLASLASTENFPNTKRILSESYTPVMVNGPHREQAQRQPNHQKEDGLLSVGSNLMLGMHMDCA